MAQLVVILKLRPLKTLAVEKVSGLANLIAATLSNFRILPMYSATCSMCVGLCDTT